jgi:MFS family permease
VYRPDSLCDVGWNDRVVLRGRAPGRRLIDRVGRRIPTTSGLVILAVGVLPITFAGQDVSIPTLLGGLSLVGIGLGLASPGL